MERRGAAGPRMPPVRMACYAHRTPSRNAAGSNGQSGSSVGKDPLFTNRNWRRKIEVPWQADSRV